MAKDKMDEDLTAAVDEATGMVSLKLSKKERKETAEVASEYEAPSYPWGTRIRLEDEALDKLDMDMPKVGARVRIEAVGEVTEVSQHESGRDKRRCVEIQLQKLAIGKGKA